MMDDKTKEIVRILNQPHRVPNMLALFKTCEKAATLIQEQAAELAKLKAQPKAAPRRSAKKADD
jgi:hypothetical protein